jgi:hypothetical protein
MTTQHIDPIERALLQAEVKAACMSHLVDNSQPLMTHDIERNGCTGLADCLVCNITTQNHD